MKSRTMFIVACMVGLFFLCSGGARAVDTVFTYTDDYANWPGYPQPPFPVNSGDEIGTFPRVQGAVITVDSNNYLKSIVIDETNLRGTETLFINTKWDGAFSTYDQWDYLVGPLNTSAAFYSVSNAFTPADYILVKDTANGGSDGWRVGHPFTIGANLLNPANGFLGAVWDGTTTLTYSFDPAAQIALFDTTGPNTKFVVGLSEDCGNDVLLTPVGVPEPLTLLLLGLGLFGIGGLARRKKS